MKFELGDVFADAPVLQQASEEADRLLREDPDALLGVLEKAAVKAVDVRSI